MHAFIYTLTRVYDSAGKGPGMPFTENLLRLLGAHTHRGVPDPDASHHNVSGTRIGLIATAVGGTGMNVWKPGGVLFENMLKRSSESLKRSLCPESDRHFLNGQMSEEKTKQTAGASSHSAGGSLHMDSDSESLRVKHITGTSVLMNNKKDSDSESLRVKHITGTSVLMNYVQDSDSESRNILHITKDSDSESLRIVQNAGIKGLVYYQGETDAGDAVSAGEYARNLTDFVGRVRHVFGANLPVVLCLISGVEARVPYREVVRDAQMSVARSFDAVRAVETCDLELRVCYVLL
jgi:hypothetical protein